MNDPKNFPDPEKFLPERWSNAELMSPFSFLTFSAGPRNCIGEKLAMLEIKIMLIEFVRLFGLSINPKASFKMKIEQVYRMTDEFMVVPLSKQPTDKNTQLAWQLNPSEYFIVLVPIGVQVSLTFMPSLCALMLFIFIQVVLAVALNSLFYVNPPRLGEHTCVAWSFLVVVCLRRVWTTQRCRGGVYVFCTYLVALILFLPTQS